MTRTNLVGLGLVLLILSPLVALLVWGFTTPGTGHRPTIEHRPVHCDFFISCRYADPAFDS